MAVEQTMSPENPLSYSKLASLQSKMSEATTRRLERGIEEAEHLQKEAQEAREAEVKERRAQNARAETLRVVNTINSFFCFAAAIAGSATIFTTTSGAASLVAGAAITFQTYRYIKTTLRAHNHKIELLTIPNLPPSSDQGPSEALLERVEQVASVVSAIALGVLSFYSTSTSTLLRQAVVPKSSTQLFSICSIPLALASGGAKIHQSVREGILEEFKLLSQIAEDRSNDQFFEIEEIEKQEKSRSHILKNIKQLQRTADQDVWSHSN